MTQHVAILGLSGDPAHLGHLALSQRIRALGYEEVWWSITPANPFKKARGREPYGHRHALANLLVRDAGPWLQLHDFEAALTDVIEEVRTETFLTHLRHVYGGAYAFTFVLGSDNWKHFHTWGGCEAVMDLASVLIANRGDEVEELLACPAAEKFRDRQDKGSDGLVAAGCWRLMPEFEHSASSSAITAELAAGLTPDHLTAAQMEYIRRYGLYGARPA